MSYPEIYPPEAGNFALSAAQRSLFVDSIDRDVSAEIIARLRASTAQMAAVQLRVLGGAMARVPVERTAFAHRSSRIMANAVAAYATPGEAPVHEAWVTGVAAALRQADAGVYVNFLGDEGEERVRAAYPGETWDRLGVVKRRYDPTNLFRLNQNIPPASGGDAAET